MSASLVRATSRAAAVFFIAALLALAPARAQAGLSIQIGPSYVGKGHHRPHFDGPGHDGHHGHHGGHRRYGHSGRSTLR